ncbi:MAG: hypothetical protein M1816_005295 [Peltula sp. TS41687]|nr:MAG: hypothetical protein M1816_005295 [Peltula sp. TS41687]
MRVLAIASKGYMEIRAIWLDVYKRDRRLQRKPNYAADHGAAREGDPVSDAHLYERRGRTDELIFRELYGFAPAKVLKIYASDKSGQIISVLNQHATLLAQQGSFPDVETAFRDFFLAVEENPGQRPSEDRLSDLEKAYTRLLQALSNHR